jgi:hypothetical protein
MTYYANYSYGLTAQFPNPNRELQFYVYRYDQTGNDFNTCFNNLNITGGTITWEQNGVQAIFSGSSIAYSYNGLVLQLNVTDISQEILSASTIYTSATTVTLTVL